MFKSIVQLISTIYVWGGRRGRDSVVVGFTTTYVISAYHWVPSKRTKHPKYNS